MRISKFAVFVSLLFVLVAPGSYAGELGGYEKANVRNISMNDGLPANAVRSIVQDKKGFIWMGTDNGLCRYDGYQVQTFNIPQNKFDQFVSALCATDDGLLVGTAQGAYLFSFRSEKFTLLSDKVNCQVSAFAKDGEGSYWIATTGKGLFRYNPRTKSCKNYPFAGWKGRVSVVFVDGNNQVWAMSNVAASVPCRLNKSTDRFEAFPLKACHELTGMAMLQDNDGSLLVGTWDNGLVRLRPDGTVEQLINPSLTNVAHRIHVLFRKSPTEILVGSDDGIVLYDQLQKSWKMLSDGKGGAVSSATERFVYSIAQDNEGGLWVGTFYGGVNYFSPIGERFQTFTSDDGKGLSGNVVGRFCEDQQHRIWVASDDGGVDCYDTAADKFVDFPGKQQLRKYNVHGLLVEDGYLWVGTYGNGLFKLNISTGATQAYQLDGRAASSSCYCIYRDSKRRLWAASMDGVSLLDERSGAFGKVKSFKTVAIDIMEDRRGMLWFSTQGRGLWCFDPTNSKWKQYLNDDKDTTSVAGDQVNCVRQDMLGNLFVATDQGICRYVPGKDSFVPLHLQTDVVGVNCIVFNQEEMWLSSSHGIVRYVPGEGCQCYNRYDGLTSDQFVSNSGLLASDGRIYFGSTHGFNAFYPYKIKVNRIAPPVFVTSLEIYNRHVSVGSEKLPESLGQIDRLDLAYDDYMFSLSFAALSYISPSKNQYAYMLEGFDKDWIYSGSAHKATYTNIPAGSYVFRVKATNNDGIWSAREAKLNIEVHPPYWWSLPAKLLYIILIGYAIYLYSQIKVRREKHRHQRELKLLAVKKEQEVRDARLEFFTMIAHEIRTPVSLIIGPLENLKAEWTKLNLSVETSKAMDATIEVIDRNAQRLLNLVNQLLDFNKVQQKAMQMHFKLQNISRLMQAVSDRFEPTMRKNGTKLEVILPPDDFAAVVDKEAVTKVVSNLMTNATKYTKDYVCLSCEVLGRDFFRIMVADNGVGIGKDEQEKIFSPFYQAKDNKPGTGIGLNIVKNLVAAHHGEVEVKSELGKGSTFVVTLPVNQQDAAVEEENKDTVLNGQVVDAEEYTDEKVEETKLGKTAQKDKPVMLVVEDDDDMRKFIATNFTEHFLVFTARNGVEALQHFHKRSVGLIVSDWMMPEMDGVELCREVRRNPVTSHIPFVMLTAKTDDSSKTEGMNCGADAYIEKPFSMKYLEACIRNLLEMRRLLQSKYSHSPLEPITEVASNVMDNDFLVKLNRLIVDNLTNRGLNVAFMADHMNISRSTLFAKIKALVDITPNEMVQLVRLKTAAEMLKTGKYRINEVCYMVGFSSPSYFTKCFLKQFGMRPGEFIDNGADSSLAPQPEMKQ